VRCRGTRGGGRGRRRGPQATHATPPRSKPPRAPDPGPTPHPSHLALRHSSFPPPPAGEDDLAGGIATDATGLTSAGLASSLPSGLETPDAMLNLRKSGDSVAGTESAQAPQLYTVLEQRKASVGQVRAPARRAACCLRALLFVCLAAAATLGALLFWQSAAPAESPSLRPTPPLPTPQGLMGTDHVYVLPGAGEGGDGGERAPRVGDKRRCAAAATPSPPPRTWVAQPRGACATPLAAR
jgi:hypothetical protein